MSDAIREHLAGDLDRCVERRAHLIARVLELETLVVELTSELECAQQIIVSILGPADEEIGAYAEMRARLAELGLGGTSGISR